MCMRLLICVILLPCSYTVADETVPEDVIPQLLQDLKVVDPKTMDSDEWKEDLLISRERLLQLLWHQKKNESQPQPVIDRIEYSAMLDGQSLRDGRISIRLSDNAATSQIVLGQTNLGQLRLFDGNIEVPLASIADRGLVPLLESGVTELNGRWSASGVRRGRTVVFDLVLPVAEVSSWRITTDALTQLTSRNALLRPLKRSGENVVWEVFPGNPKLLTLESQQVGEGDSEVVFLSVDSELKLLQDVAHVEWSVPLPRSLSGSVLRFEIRGNAVVSGSRLSGADVESEIVVAGAQRYIDVSVPDSVAGVLTIAGTSAPESTDVFSLSFLRPVNYRSAGGHRQELSLQSSVVRIEVDSQAVVKRLETAGLSRKDVSFAGDGSQVLELEQYMEDASATIQVAESLPLVQDEVVVQTQASGDDVKATAYVRASATSGTVSTLSWDIPANWRVTDVRELDVGSSPLLFRIRDTASRQFNQVEVTLRTPLQSRSIYQGLVIQMQSVDTSLALQQPATLESANYQRRSDLVLLSAADAERLVNSWTDAEISRTELASLVPWLPTVEDELTAYRRSQLKLVDSVSIGRAEVMATVDYSTESTGRQIRETTSIRLSSEEELPARIPISLSSKAAPEVSPGSSDVRLIRSDQTAENDWVIELIPSSKPRKDVEFSLITTRRMQSRLNGLVVRFPTCRQTGRIVPPASDSRFVLSIDNNITTSVVESAVEYPSQDFTLLIEGVASAAAARELSGRGFLLANHEHLDGLARLLVTPAGVNDVLVLQAPEADVRVFINGRETHIDSFEGELRISLPDAMVPAEVDVYFRMNLNAETVLQFPVVKFPQTSQDVNWFIMTADSVDAVMDAAQQKLPSCSSTDVSRLVIDDALGETPGNRALMKFASQWMLTASFSETCVVVASSNSVRTIQFLPAAVSSQFAWMCFWATLTAILWQVSGKLNARRLGLVILLILGVHYLQAEKRTLLEGCLVGSLLFFVVRCVSMLLIRTPDSLSGRISTSGIKLLLIFGVAASSSAFAQSSADARIISIGDKSESSILYVQRSFHDALQEAIQTQENAQIAVLDTQLSVTVESAAAAVATIRTNVAVPGQETQSLALPLAKSTLIQCRLNDKVVFPRRDSAGNTIVKVVHSAQVSDMPLAGNTQTAASGPRNFGIWRLSTIEYKVRLPLKSLNGASRLSLEFPQSPVVSIGLVDPGEMIAEARLRGSGGQLQSQMLGSRIVFPSLSNVGEIEIDLALRGADPRDSDVGNSAEVVCYLEVLPDRVVSKTAYRFSAADLQVEELVLNVSPDRITSVKSESGQPVLWTVVDGGILIALDSDNAAQQTVTVAQEVNKDLGLTSILDVRKMRLLNGEPAATMRLVVSTADQFIVDRILSGGVQLPSIPASATSEPQSLRTTERQVVVPENVEAVSVSIAERISTQIVDVFQSVVVRDDSIDWNCRCESEISGQPSFRQVIFLSPGVRVESVTATLLGTDRLQSWSRTKDSVVVSLREATRGNLEVQLEGSIPRVVGRRTALPLVGFQPDVQALQSSVEVSAESQGATYVSSFGGVIPDDAFDTETALTPSPIRFSIIDDSLPMMIQESKSQSVDARVATLVYDNAGQTRVTTVMELTVQNSSAPVRFRTRNAEINSQLPIVYQDGEAVATSRVAGVTAIPASRFDAGKKCLLVLPNVVPLIRGESLSVSLPDFEAATNVSASVCYDLRQNAGTGFQNSEVPGWITSVVSDLPIPKTSTARKFAAAFVPESRKIQVRLPGKRKNSVDDSIAADVQYVDCEHHVRTGTPGTMGTTSLLVFASQSRSQFAVSLPQHLVVGRVTINGEPVQIKRTQTALSIMLPSKISHMVIDWVHSVSTGFGPNTHDISLPGTLQASGRHRIFVKRPHIKSRWWRVLEQQQPSESYQEARLASIVTGLQLLDLAGAASAEGTVGEPASSLTPALFDQLTAQSQTAATSLDRFLFGAEQDDCILVLTAQPQLQVFDFVLPSLFFCGTFLLGVALVVSPLLSVMRRGRRKLDSEAPTVVSQSNSSGEPVTVIDPQPDSAAK